MASFGRRLPHDAHSMSEAAPDVHTRDVSRSLLRGLVFRMKNKLLAGPLQDSGLIYVTSRTANVMRVEKIVAQHSAAAARFAIAYTSTISQRSMVGANVARMIIPSVVALHKSGRVIPELRVSAMSGTSIDEWEI
jgi:hypothetical protein